MRKFLAFSFFFLSMATAGAQSFNDFEYGTCYSTPDCTGPYLGGGPRMPEGSCKEEIYILYTKPGKHTGVGSWNNLGCKTIDVSAPASNRAGRIRSSWLNDESKLGYCFGLSGCRPRGDAFEREQMSPAQCMVVTYPLGEAYVSTKRSWSTDGKCYALPSYSPNHFTFDGTGTNLQNGQSSQPGQFSPSCAPTGDVPFAGQPCCSGIIADPTCQATLIRFTRTPLIYA